MLTKEDNSCGSGDNGGGDDDEIEEEEEEEEDDDDDLPSLCEHTSRFPLNVRRTTSQSTLFTTNFYGGQLTRPLINQRNNQ
jgi:hypothetical protein